MVLELFLVLDDSKESIFFIFGFSVFELFIKFLFLGWDENCGLCIVVIKVVDYMSIFVLVI